jgi:hypothetical protein
VFNLPLRIVQQGALSARPRRQEVIMQVVPHMQDLPRHRLG